MPISQHLDSADSNPGSFTYAAVRLKGDRYGRTILRTSYSEEYARFYAAECGYLDNDDYEVVIARSPGDFGFRAPIDDDTFFAEPHCRSMFRSLNAETITMVHEDVRGLWELAELDGGARLSADDRAMIRDLNRMVGRITEILDAERDQTEDRLPDRDYCWSRFVRMAKRGRKTKASEQERAARRLLAQLVDEIGEMEEDAVDGIADIVRRIRKGESSARAVKQFARLD